MLGGELLPEVRVQVATAMLNRHGLIAGATGTGKTKTLQLLAGELSAAGIPVFVADIKGDLTGLAAAGDGTNQAVLERAASMAWTFTPSAHPVEFLSLSGKLGAQVRASVHSFGPLLLGKVLDLNPTQTSILSLVFKYCDDKALPLLDLPDLATTLRFLSSDDGKPILDEYGGMSKASVGVLLRALGGAGAGRRRRLLRRAVVRCRRPDAHHARRQGRHQRPGAVRRDGQAAPVQHLHAVAPRPAVPGAAGGG